MVNNFAITKKRNTKKNVFLQSIVFCFFVDMHWIIHIFIINCFISDIPVVTATPLAYSVNIGSSVTLKCSVLADPLHTSVTWKKLIGGTASNIPITNSGGKYSGATVNDPSLTINNAAFSDQGTYVCYATNSVGTGQSTQVVVAVAGSKILFSLNFTNVLQYVSHLVSTQ